MTERDIALKVANYLLQIKAIKLQPANPFQWASGWNSPIYCDNRKTLSFPEVRQYIKNSFVEIIRDKFPDTEVIAGVATGGIAIGALVAEELDLPFVYVRSSSKSHGLQNQVEGSLPEGSKVTVVEDLVSTGKSSLNAVDAIRETGSEVLGMVAIFTYGFEVAINNFQDKNCELFTLSNYETMIEKAIEQKYIEESEMDSLKSWREDPSEWKPKKTE